MSLVVLILILGVGLQPSYDQAPPYGPAHGMTWINKFGRSTNVDNGINTDIWDRANATDDQDIWTAPTDTGCVHDIVSSSINDDGSPAGTGARTLTLYGLTDWKTPEVSETLTLNGTTNVATTNSYVIIYRMRVQTKGSAGPNVGTITATATTCGATVTAQINAGEGQTQMAIYGCPEGSTMRVTSYYVSSNKATAAATRINHQLLWNPTPADELTTFLVKSTTSTIDDGVSHFQHHFNPYATFACPGILKLQSNASANDADVSGGFDAVIVRP